MRLFSFRKLFVTCVCTSHLCNMSHSSKIIIIIIIILGGADLLLGTLTQSKCGHNNTSSRACSHANTTPVFSTNHTVNNLQGCFMELHRHSQQSAVLGSLNK